MMDDLIGDIINLHQDKLNLLKKITTPKIGWTSISTPEEIIYAAGLIPYRITGDMVQSTPKAGARMHMNICSYVLSCLEEGLEGIHDFSDGIVIVNACDARRRLYEVWKRFINSKFVHMLDLPKVVNPDTTNYFKNELHRLIQAIQQHFNCEISKDSLRQAITSCNETRGLLSRLYHMRKSDNPPITGAQAIKILQAAMSGLKKDYNERLSKLLLEIDSQKNAAPRPTPQHRVLLSGSYFDHVDIIHIIEQMGAIVVCEDLSNGIKYFENQVNPHGDPVEALANYYLQKATCARMLDSQKRFNHMYELIQQYNVHSVIYFSLKFCDNNLMDFPYQKKRLKEKGIPVLFLEIERTITSIEQIKTRIQTFLETQLVKL